MSLRIRGDQLAEFRQQKEQDFVARMSTNIPEDFVRKALASARGFGITREDHVARFTQTLWDRHGDDSELSSKEQNVLMAETADAEGKVTSFEQLSSTGATGTNAASDFSGDDVGSVVQPCPYARTEHWIEIELIGEDDAGIPHARYEVKLPDGRVVQGNLDRYGFARVERFASGGTCLVCFPELDEEAWVPEGG